MRDSHGRREGEGRSETINRILSSSVALRQFHHHKTMVVFTGLTELNGNSKACATCFKNSSTILAYGSRFSLIPHPVTSVMILLMPSPNSSDLTLDQPESDEKVVQSDLAPSRRGAKFWLIFVSMCTCLSLSALELSSVSTVLPTIANALHASQFTWVGSAYALASTAFLPMSGGLAQTFGRRPAVLFAIGLFALGSGICGGANSMNMLTAGRAVQGFGGGGIQSLTGIILADLVTLQERGLYAGLYGL